MNGQGSPGRYSARGLDGAISGILAELRRQAVGPEERATLDTARTAHVAGTRHRAGRNLVPQEPAFRDTKPRRRGTQHRREGDLRGNSTDRHRRKVFLLNKFGDGTRVRCHRCRLWLTYDELTVDRWPILARDGGRYTRNNIRPACSPCNSETGGMAATETGRARLAEEESERA
jgi:5-methylcytosine-specific restriction endonuclease McrA